MRNEVTAGEYAAHMKRIIDAASRGTTPAPSKQPEPLLSDLAMMTRRLILVARRHVADDHKDLSFANDCLRWLAKNGLTGTPLRDTTPPKAPEPLTDEEILELEKLTPALDDAGSEWIYFARSVEAAVHARYAK
jgi:hypothetical protein